MFTSKATFAAATTLLLMCTTFALAIPASTHQGAQGNQHSSYAALQRALMEANALKEQSYDTQESVFSKQFDSPSNEPQYDLVANEQVLGTGVTYTRFGKSSCRAGAELVYSGRVGGSHYTHRGGGSNYLCLPKDPQYSKTRPGAQFHSILYGTEYEYPLNGKHDENVPCAVCYASRRSSTLMIPASLTCPKRYTMEYQGFLMSGHFRHHRTEFICVDKDQEYVPGSSHNTNGALVYHVEADCHTTGMPCPPYDSTKELTCVVCSR